MEQNQKIINILNMVSDACVIFISYLVSVEIRFFYFDGHMVVNPVSNNFLFLAAFYSVASVFAFYIFRMYGSYRFSSSFKEAFIIFLINGFGVMCLMAVMFLFRVQDFSRILFVILWVVESLVLISKRIVTRKIICRLFKINYYKKNVAVIGNGDLALQFVQDAGRTPQYNIDIVGYVSSVEKEGLGKCLGPYEELEKIINEYDIDEVVVALEYHESGFIHDIFTVADKEGIGIKLIPFYNSYFPKNATMESVGRIKLINARTIPLDNLIYAFIKRSVDILGSLFGLIIVSPIMLIAAIGVKISSPGPIFFMQDRVGLHKKPFKMYKFRSMRVNTEETTGWSKNVDPRKTKFGSFIRKYSIDELPQLINVLKGDMSLIGPRPEIPFYVAKFKEDVPLYLLRQQVRPGMTGWAQVHGLRGDTSIESRVEYDIWYIENWSLWLDVKIMIKTIFGGWINNEVINK